MTGKRMAKIVIARQVYRPGDHIIYKMAGRNMFKYGVIRSIIRFADGSVYINTEKQGAVLYVKRITHIMRGSEAELKSILKAAGYAY